MENLFSSLASTLAALGVVIVVAWGVLKLMRARMQPGGKRDGGADELLRFVRALPVGAKERVVIVEHRGERWMLGVTAGAISTIAHWPSREARDPHGVRDGHGTRELHPLRDPLAS